VAVSVPAGLRARRHPYNQANLLRVCHRRRLRSAISVCPLLRPWGSSASRLGAGRSGSGRATLNEPSAPLLTIYDTPHRGMRVRPIRGHVSVLGQGILGRDVLSPHYLHMVSMPFPHHFRRRVEYEKAKEPNLGLMPILSRCPGRA
jgi:hypothetical protein